MSGKCGISDDFNQKTAVVAKRAEEVSQPALIVCASLVQNPMNLGMLCRTCEVFGVATLVLPELAVVTTSAFRKLSASAYQWQSLQVCPPTALENWLVHHQALGYQILGMTVKKAVRQGGQSSVQTLASHRFVAKTVLVLGQELTGLPPEIEALCDAAIAIPQYGQVDSLNVQTAAAIAIYAYVCQWHSPDPTD